MEDRLRGILNRVAVTDKDEEELLFFGRPVPSIDLDSCITDPIFLYVLRTFVGLSEYLQLLRTPIPKDTGKSESILLNNLELMRFPREYKDESDLYQTSHNEDLFWNALRENLKTGEPICSILRRVDDDDTENNLNYRTLTECCEVTLNLFRCYVIQDYAFEWDLQQELKQDLRKCGMDQIESTRPLITWFEQTGTSIYVRTYRHLPLPRHLNDDILQGTNSSRLYSFIHYLLQRIFGWQDASTTNIVYSDLSVEEAKLVRSELTQVICHVPFVIELFLKYCEELPVTVSFSFPPEGMEKKIAKVMNCSSEEAKSLTNRLKLVLEVFEENGMVWAKVPKGDLIGLSLLLREELLTFTCRKHPSNEQLKFLQSFIMPRENQDPDAICILPLIITDVYFQLNEACFKSKLQVMASLVSYRLALEKLWDQQTFLLRKDMFDHLKEFSPRYRNHQKIIDKLETDLLKIENSQTVPDTICEAILRCSLIREKVLANQLNMDNIRSKINHVKADRAEHVLGVLLVLMESRGKLWYTAKTYYGSSIQLLEPNNEHDLQGLDLEQNAQGLFQRMMAFLGLCRSHVLGCEIRITLGLVTTTCKAGGILAIAASQVGMTPLYRLFTLPSRILTFYRDMDASDPPTLMEQAWTCFSTNFGHQSVKLCINNNQHHCQQQQLFMECQYQFEDNELCYKVLCSLLHVAIVSKRVDYLRCFNDITYANIIQFLIQCSSERMKQIRAVITEVRTVMEDQDARETLLRRFTKKRSSSTIGTQRV